MALSTTVRVRVEMDDLFPLGAQCLGVEEELDFDKRRAKAADTQKRDKETGLRLWSVKVVDLDPKALEFGGSAQVKVLVVSDEAPVVPARQDPRFPPLVVFDGLELTPYADARSCNNKQDKNDRCKARVAFSIRSTGMRAAASPGRPAGVDENGEVISKSRPSSTSKAAA